MLNTNSVDTVNSSRFSQRFVKPCYGSYCFSNIPQTLGYMLTGEDPGGLPTDILGDLPARYEKVILFFVDGFGWRFFERYADKYTFLKTMLKDGVVSKMTSQFPSTTAAHVTCIHTGLNVGQSGIYEWNYFEPLVDEVITPLMFSYASDKERDTLKRAQIPAEDFYPRQTVYQKLKDRGVISYIYQNKAYTPSTYSDVVFRGANVVPFTSISPALTSLCEVVLAHKAPPYYYYLYYDHLDATCHIYGPNSPEFEKEVETFFKLMEQIFYRNLHGKVKKTLFVMTADHGLVETTPKTTFYLNQQAPDLLPWLQTNQKGRPIVPAGSARDMFLHVKDEHVAEAINYLQTLLEGRAEVYQTSDLIAQGFFGLEEPSAAFLRHAGNVVILPYQNETVWWYEEGKYAMKFQGHHGGLTPEEMEIPLLLLPLG